MAFLGGLIAAVVIWLYVHEGIRDQELSTLQQSPLVWEEEMVRSELPVRENGMIAHTSNKVLESSLAERDKEPVIRVYLSERGVMETIGLEDYVRGVVAAEMPLNFQPAALEVQALAARTYIIRRLWLEEQTGSGTTSSTAQKADIKDTQKADITDTQKADITDTQKDQVYKSLEEMRRLQMDNPEGWRKVDEAVKKTSGNIIVYGGTEPIEALYFSTSNGYTENSEEVFLQKLPYLRSVASPWDKESSPRAQESIKMKLEEFYEKLGVKAVRSAGIFSKKQAIRITESSEGRRIKELAVGDHKFTGVELRKRLGLRSAAIEWEINKGWITLTTYGSGHGVGMSQWGAEGMARAGKTAEQIIEHYYTDTQIAEASSLLKEDHNRIR